MNTLVNVKCVFVCDCHCVPHVSKSVLGLIRLSAGGGGRRLCFRAGLAFFVVVGIYLTAFVFHLYASHSYLNQSRLQVARCTFSSTLLLLGESLPYLRVFLRVQFVYDMVRV